MNRLPEAVTTKFTELFAVLYNATDDLKMAGAEACLMGDFSQVEAVNDLCSKLQAVESYIKTSMINREEKRASFQDSEICSQQNFPTAFPLLEFEPIA